MDDYLIYGANGYTGELIAREAKQRGQSPILAGRNAAAVGDLARELGLPQRSFDLADPAAVDRGLSGVRAVLHCAGPFAITSRPMADACVRNRVHYLDVTGEIDVLEALAARDAEAKAAQVMLLPATGFDVVPSDCLAAHLARRMPDATQLRLGFQALGGGLSRGTAVTTIAGMGRPNLVRRGGVLTPVPMGRLARRIDFGRGPTAALSIPWGDVATAYHSTGIPDIEVYVAVPAPMLQVVKLNSLAAPLLRSARFQAFLSARVRAGRAGPTAEQRAHGRSYLWGEVRDASGKRLESRLQTPEAYALTALTALAATERTLAGGAKPGFQTPSRAFGADFILEFANVERQDF
jgi:short subunit dehydrogenase-like uncharacterized protein